MKAEELKKGNLILFDHHSGRESPTPIIRGIVESAANDLVTFENGHVSKITECAGIPLDDSWINFLKKTKEDAAGLTFVHELQNA